jgi:hypothetical protein
MAARSTGDVKLTSAVSKRKQQPQQLQQPRINDSTPLYYSMTSGELEDMDDCGGQAHRCTHGSGG